MTDRAEALPLHLSRPRRGDPQGDRRPHHRCCTTQLHQLGARRCRVRDSRRWVPILRRHFVLPCNSRDKEQRLSCLCSFFAPLLTVPHVMANSMTGIDWRFASFKRAGRRPLSSSGFRDAHSLRGTGSLALTESDWALLPCISWWYSRVRPGRFCRCELHRRGGPHSRGPGSYVRTGWILPGEVSMATIVARRRLQVAPRWSGCGKARCGVLV